MNQVDFLVARMPPGRTESCCPSGTVVAEREARIAPGCTACHCPSMSATSAPAAGPIRSIHARVPPDGGKVASVGGLLLAPADAPVVTAPEQPRTIHARLPPGAGMVCSVPSLGLTVTVNLPIEPLTRPIHDKFTDAKGQSAEDQIVTTSLSPQGRGIDIDLKLEMSGG